MFVIDPMIYINDSVQTTRMHDWKKMRNNMLYLAITPDWEYLDKSSPYDEVFSSPKYFSFLEQCMMLAIFWYNNSTCYKDMKQEFQEYSKVIPDKLDPEQYVNEIVRISNRIIKRGIMTTSLMDHWCYALEVSIHSEGLDIFLNIVYMAIFKNTKDAIRLLPDYVSGIPCNECLSQCIYDLYTTNYKDRVIPWTLSNDSV
jgi:hypothetical protein